jgi:uncharacterized membrane protein YecN with MAPEG domain
MATLSGQLALIIVGAVLLIVGLFCHFSGMDFPFQGHKSIKASGLSAAAIGFIMLVVGVIWFLMG